MTDWTAGYVTDIGYIYGCYNELNPLRVRLAFLSAGLHFPSIGTACELGFGQGLSVNIHAAASTVSWHGTDFNPSQAGFAQELAHVSGAGAQLFDDAFGEFCSRDDLPAFDYIVLHGIWSWISDDNRATLIDFVRRKLKIGGVFYISYNTQQGWAATVPLRALLTEHAEMLAAPADRVVNRIDAALEFADRLFKTNPLYALDNPLVAERLKLLKKQNRNYLAHEYFNKDWHPMLFSEMAKWLAPTKLSYACSAHYFQHIDILNLTSEQSAFLKEIPDLIFRETVRDFMTSQQFRRDYWVRGARKLNPLEQLELLRAQRVILTSERSAVSLKVAGALDEVLLSEEIYNPILDVLSDHQPKALGEIEQVLSNKRITLPTLLQTAMMLTGAGYLELAQDEHVTSQVKPRTDKLNAHLIHKARGSGEINFLASPVTGTGVAVSRFQQLFLQAIREGREHPVDWAQFAWQIISAQGELIRKDGKVLESIEENISELNSQAQEFAVQRLSVLKALQIF